MTSFHPQLKYGILLVWSLFFTGLYGQQNTNGVLIRSASQNEASMYWIYLHDGSILKGEYPRKVSDTSNQVILLLKNGHEIILDAGTIRRILPIKNDRVLMQDGRQARINGHYRFMCVNMLTGYRWDNNHLRYKAGLHYSVGHQFSPRVSIGAGAGIDYGIEVLLPFYLEFRGSTLLKRNPPSLLSGTGNQRWRDELTLDRRRRVGIAYGTQIGFNIPVYVKDDQNSIARNLRSGLLLYPHLGFIFPTRTGSSFQIDFGYKIQHFSVLSILWFGNSILDLYESVNLSFRLGWSF